MSKVSNSIPVLSVGDSFYCRDGGIYKHHVVAVLEEEGQVIHKYFGKHKQWWHYKIESIYSFNCYLDIGLYTKNRGKL